MSMLFPELRDCYYNSNYDCGISWSKRFCASTDSIFQHILQNPEEIVYTPNNDPKCAGGFESGIVSLVFGVDLSIRKD